jgi:hypothetical protein
MLPQTFFAASIDALVTTAQNRDSSAPLLEGPGKFFDHGGLAGSADRQIADTDDETPELSLLQNSIAIQAETELNDREIKEGEKPKRDPQQGCAKTVPLIEDDFDRILFKLIQAPPHALFF